MTDGINNFASLQEKNIQVLADISQLQATEKQLYVDLAKNNLTSEKKQQIIDKINNISQIRIGLYTNLNTMTSFYQKNVGSSTDTLVQQKLAIDIIENELNDSKIQVNLLEEQKNNKLRVVEINTYYGKRYNAYKKNDENYYINLHSRDYTNNII